jgi:predicted dehydrogenase
MSARKLRVGVAGAGFGALVHVPGFLSEGWEVPVIFSRSAERGAKAARDLGVAEHVTDYRMMIDRKDLDAIAVVTPVDSHHEITMAALRAGKHVLCEKPFAVNVAEAREMEQEALKRKLVGMDAHEFRFAPQRAYIAELIGQGYLGQLRYANVNIEVAFRRNPQGQDKAPARLGGGHGMIGSQGSHFVDCLMAWFGGVKRVSANARALMPTQPIEDTFSIALDFARGGTGVLTFTSVATVAQGVRTMLHGTDGALLASHPGPNPLPEGEVYGGKSGESALKQLPMPAQYRPFVDDRDHRLLSFRLMVRQFERGIREGVSPSPNFTDGVRVQEVLDAARESSEQGGRTVALTLA